MPRVIGIVQARVGSTRLPGKVHADLCGRSVLGHVLFRMRQAKTLDSVVVATGNHPDNDSIQAFCFGEHIACCRGSNDDVLDRFYLAALWHKADYIVRVSGDSPLIDPEVIDAVVEMAQRSGISYASNVEPPSWPDGLDTECVSLEALRLAWLKARLQSDREHVTPWLRRNLPAEQKANLTHAPDWSGYRLCIDTPDDLTAMRRIMALVGPDCTWRQAVAVLDGHPEIARLSQATDRNAAYLAQVAKEEQTA